MTIKLTLTIDDAVIKSAKKYAEKKRRSLSDIVENYLKSISRKEENEIELYPKISRLKGAIKLPDNFDYKKSLSKELSKKYKM